jgi:hypothetical protein
VIAKNASAFLGKEIQRSPDIIGEPLAVLLNNHDLGRDCHYRNKPLGLFSSQRRYWGGPELCWFSYVEFTMHNAEKADRGFSSQF